MRINVTAKHIRNSRLRGANRCALALAIQDATGDHHWSVGLEDAYYLDRKIKLPVRAYRFRLDLDQGKKVQPFAFNLPVESSNVR